MHALQHLPSVADDEGRRLQRVLTVLQWAEMKRDRLALSIWVEQIWLRLGGSLQPVVKIYGVSRRFYRYFVRQKHRDWA
ncbi:MAG: hypothetical protein CM15mP84_07720 [Cellvibrionales bacterium]|nr:MAG: hypothetical protein CM15mP84_07720 [Cellvibrionales bacterium]